MRAAIPLLAVGAAAIVVVAACTGSNSGTIPTNSRSAPATDSSSAPATGIHKIKHIIVIMQENRSFDTYFGTYPGADGIPMSGGKPTVCVPAGAGSRARSPMSITPMSTAAARTAQVNAHRRHQRRQDGRLRRPAAEPRSRAAPISTNPACANSATPDVMGYHTQSDIPNYWSYAQNYVLQDHMFEPNASWSLPAHLFMVSEWSAHCTHHNDPASCVNQDRRPRAHPTKTPEEVPPDLRVDRHDLPAHKNNVSWGYYIVSGTEPDCRNDASLTCPSIKQNAQTPGIWNPLPYFDTVSQDGQLGNIQSVSNYFFAARTGTLARGQLGHPVR